MAEQWTKAFGRYLRTLRERRQLSLQDVCSLSQPFADTLNKGYLSRCENGHQRLAFSKVIALSRIYDVPADVLLERMELDMELERVGAPATEAMSFIELTDAGIEAAARGHKWEYYAFMRDALPLSVRDPLRDRYRDFADQIGNAHMNCASAAKTLGKTRYALHELHHLESAAMLSPKFAPLLLDRISICYRSRGEFALAEKYIESAIAKAEATLNKDALGCLYGSRANLAVAQSNLQLATNFYQKAFGMLKETGRRAECARTLNNLAWCYLDMKRYQAARRAGLAAERLTRSLSMERPFALSQLLLGEIDELCNRHELATQRWREAVEIARQLGDKELRFKVEFLLFRQALNNGDLPAARALERRLRRLQLWVPKDTPEVAAFNSLSTRPAEAPSLTSNIAT